MHIPKVTFQYLWRREGTDDLRLAVLSFSTFSRESFKSIEESLDSFARETVKGLFGKKEVDEDIIFTVVFVQGISSIHGHKTVGATEHREAFREEIQTLATQFNLS
jgi:hypothetical protein